MAGFTYTTLTQAIKDYTENTESTFVSQIDTFIKNAEERILKDAQLEEFRKNASAALTSGNKYLPKPTDWLFTYSLSITASSNHKFLRNKDVNFIQEYWPNASTTGEPKYYADYDVDNFIIAPTPDAAYATELHYFYRPESITVISGGVTWMGTNASQALLYGALVEAYTFMKGDAELLIQYEERYNTAIMRIKMLGEVGEVNDSYRRGLIRGRT